MTSKKMFTRNQAIWRYTFAFLLVVIGIIFNYLEFSREFLGFGTVGNWLIFVGLVMFAVVTLQLMKGEKRIIDERMEKIGYKASRVTFLFIIFGGFAIMICDGISKIEVSYSVFMSNFIAWVVLVYFVSYKILEKYN